MGDEELRAVELDENIQQEPLANYETTKARLAEINQVEAKLKAEDKKYIGEPVPKKSSRGTRKKAASKEALAVATGTSRRTQQEMEKQGEIAERFPFLRQQERGRDQTLRAGKLMELEFSFSCSWTSSRFLRLRAGLVAHILSAVSSACHCAQA